MTFWRQALAPGNNAGRQIVSGSGTLGGLLKAAILMRILVFQHHQRLFPASPGQTRCPPPGGADGYDGGWKISREITTSRNKSTGQPAAHEGDELTTGLTASIRPPLRQAALPPCKIHPGPSRCLKNNFGFPAAAPGPLVMAGRASTTSKMVDA